MFFIRTFLVGLAIAAWLFSTSPTQAAEPTDSRPAPTTINPNVTYFPETGHYLGSSFRPYWQKYGGLAQFGLPLTEEFQQLNPEDKKTYTVQYFERARFEYHPEHRGTFYEVELGLLGKQYAYGWVFQEGKPIATNKDHIYFPETRHTLNYSFKSYWEKNGGLAIYGYPISEEVREGGYTVQYFERARFEYHYENRGTPFEVQLGLLGTATLQEANTPLPQIYRVEPTPTTIVQGRALEVNIIGINGETVRSSLNGIALAVVSSGGKMTAIGGISSNAPLKPQILKTEITDARGIVRRFEQAIVVSAGKFDEQTIELSPEVEASLGSAEDAARERARVYGIYAQVTPEKLWEGRFIRPCTGPITTQFGSRRYYVGGGTEIHDALDIGATLGTPILAPARGRIVLAEFQKVRGNIVIIDHGMGLHSAYFHQSQIKVKVGDIVKKGDIIGLAGTTGLSTGVHLHWEMRIGTIGIDPAEWLNRDF